MVSIESETESETNRVFFAQFFVHVFVICQKLKNVNLYNFPDDSSVGRISV